MKKIINQRFSATTDFRIVGKLAFVSVTALVAFSAFLMNVGLGMQRDMLQASNISYEQRIYMEYIGKRLVFLMNNLSEPDVSDYSMIDVKNDIFKLKNKVIANHFKLKRLVNNELPSVTFNNGAEISNIALKLSRIDKLLSKLDSRVNEINSSTLVELRLSRNYGRPIDVLVASNGVLNATAEELSDNINELSLNQNEFLYVIYAFLLVLVLMGVWVIWYFTLRPLGEKLSKNYQEIQLKNETLDFQARHDNLTALPNRAEFMNKAAQLYESNGLLGNVALMLIDIDNFKSINDNYGHHTGDKVLIQFSQRLAMDMPSNEVLYRLSGDEFAIVIPDVNDRQYIVDRANTIIANLRVKSNLLERNFPLNGSIGIAWGDKCGSSLEELFSAADMALYHVKDNGRNNYAFYDDISTFDILEILEIEQELYKAVDNREFTVYYQPIMDLENNSIAKMEALVRWQHPEKGLLLPAQWMPIAERMSIFSSINMQVFDIVESNYKTWQAEGLHCPTIFINITESLLLSGMGYEQIECMFERSLSSTPWLAVEVTESVVLDRSYSLAKYQLDLMRGAGIKVALDDFGTGFANLSHLNTIPFDTIKIDQSFVSKILSDDSMHMIVESIIDLAKKLKKEIVCEGVDSEDVKRSLIKMGCKFSQGFLHSKPLPFNEMSCLLQGSKEVKNEEIA